MDSFFSIKTLVMNKISSFSSLFKSDREVVRQILAETAIRVAHSKEEGVPFSSAVFVVESLEHLLKTVNGSNPISIGEGDADLKTVRVALKNSIPLGEGRQWAVYFVLNENHLEYGIFCTQRSTLKKTSFELLRQLDETSGAIVGITRLGSASLEVRGGGSCEYFDFSGVSDFHHNPQDVIKAFASSITQDVPLKIRPQCKTFYSRIIVEILNSGNGSLIVILKKGEQLPEILSDGIWLKNPLKINSFIKNYEETHSEKDSLALIDHGSLIRMMAAMDGVVVFGSDGSLYAYNCFIRAPLVGSPLKSVIGGARRRAFKILCKHLEQDLLAVFYHSQDGAAECRVRTIE